MSLLGLFSLFCLLLFIGAIVHSRATLIVFSVCGLFSILLLWLLASIYVTMAVALAGKAADIIFVVKILCSEFCYKPTPWVQLALNHSFNLSEEISMYYLKCNEHSKQNPFRNALRVSHGQT